MQLSNFFWHLGDFVSCSHTKPALYGNVNFMMMRYLVEALVFVIGSVQSDCALSCALSSCLTFKTSHPSHLSLTLPQ